MYQDLKPDPAESGGTNDLLRTLIQATNATLIVSAPTFTVPHEVIVSNSLFFSSLCCSLFAAFGAVLAKQWLSEYERVGEDRTPYMRGRQRHTRHLAMRQYRCEIVIQGLGSVLQISLFLFFVALAYWLWSINRTVASVVIAGVLATLIFYISTTAISIFDEFSPFSTRVSATLRRIFPSTMRARLVPSTTCVMWLYEKATSFQTIRAISEAWVRFDFDQLDIPHHVLSSRFLKAAIASDAITNGYTEGTLMTTLRALQAIDPWRSRWNDKPRKLDDNGMGVVRPMQQCFTSAAIKHDLLMCESIMAALPDPIVVKHGREQLDRDTLIELIESPMTQVLARDKAAAYLLKQLPVDPYYNLCAVPSGSLAHSWQWRLVNALFKHEPDPMPWGGETPFMPARQLLLVLLTQLRFSNSLADPELWITAQTRLSGLPAQLEVLSRHIISKGSSEAGCLAGGRILLHLWLQRRYFPDLSIDQNHLIPFIQLTTWTRVLPQTTAVLGPLLWWPILTEATSKVQANPDFLLNATFRLMDGLKCNASGQCIFQQAPWLYQPVTEALDAYASSVRSSTNVRPPRAISS